MAISCLGFNTIALFSRQIFKIDDAPVNASLIFWFCFAEMICSVTWNSPMGDYQTFDWRANILIQSERSVRRRTDRLKKGPRPCRRFFVVPAPISSRFLGSHPPSLLYSAPKQNRHATQATSLPSGLSQSVDGRLCWAWDVSSNHARPLGMHSHFSLQASSRRGDFLTGFSLNNWHDFDDYTIKLV